jgi:hypothetical protein
MRGLLRLLLCVAMPAALVGWSEPGAPARHQVVDNVVFDLALTADGLTACLNTTRGAKLSGPYGVLITAPAAAGAWDEALPKTVAVEEDYFPLPLRVDLKRRPGSAQPGRLQLEVGACQPEGMCVPVELAVDTAALGGASAGVACGS